ncbi:MAG: cupin domain-containing protein [Lachnospiraceae bacterium]|nr:cupin domain-containing protein [Lachnospiraceae bacterium]
MEKYLSMVSLDDVETQVLDWGTFQWLNDPRVTGTKHMVLGLGIIKPGFGHTRHNHGCDEFIYFLQGKAEQTIERPDGLQKKELGPGEMIFIPKEGYHSTINIGDDDLKFLCCYLEAGTELDIANAAIEIIPPKNNWKDE